MSVLPLLPRFITLPKIPHSTFHISLRAPWSPSPCLQPAPLLPPDPLQHWDQGGGDSEEPERFAAGEGIQAGPQSALLTAPAGPQPQPAHRLAIPQPGLPASQTPLQLSRHTLSYSLSHILSLLLYQTHSLAIFVFSFCFFLSPQTTVQKVVIDQSSH